MQHQANPLPGHSGEGAGVPASDADDVIRAITRGEVDAFVVSAGERAEVLMLSTADTPYRLLVDHMPQGAVTLSSDGAIRYANRRFAEMLGLTSEMLSGTKFTNFAINGDIATLDALIARRALEHAPLELALRRGDGTSFPVSIVAHAVLEEAGATSLVITDLTQQKQYEALVAEEALGRAILEQALDSIVVCDTHGRVIRASRSAIALCRSNPFLRPFAEAFSMQDERILDIDAVLDGKVVRNVELSLSGVAPEPLNVLASAGPIVDADGRTVGAVVTLTNITERKRVEDALRNADRRKDEFMAYVAHELRGPITSIMNSAEVLKRSAADHSRVAKAQQIVERQAAHLVRVVNDLMDFDRVRLGRIRVERKALDLRSVIDQALEMSLPFIDQGDHDLRVSQPPEPVMVHGDAVRLTQVVANLLHNAAKFTPEKGAITVALERDVSAPYAVISVTDTGVGIAPELIDKVFDLYMQGTPSGGRVDGLGIGLTLAQQIVKVHGGTVSAQSDGPGRGSRFIVRLPILSM